jgi:hypothetical protein
MATSRLVLLSQRIFELVGSNILALGVSNDRDCSNHTPLHRLDLDFELFRCSGC